MLQGQPQAPTQEEKSPDNGNRKGKGCLSPCSQHPFWSKCYYLNPTIRPLNVEEDLRIWKEIDALIAVNPRMVTTVKSIQERSKKKEDKKKDLSDLPPPPIAPTTSQNLASTQF